MITEKLIEYMARGAVIIFNMLPFSGFRFPVAEIENALGPVVSFFGMAAYFVPMPTIVLILGIILAKEMIKIMIAFLRMLTSLLPFF